VTITGVSTTTGATFAWTGPGGFTANTAAAMVSLGGTYNLTVTNPSNGCVATKALTVQADTAKPAGVTATNSGELTCTVFTVTLTGNSTTPGVNYLWTGPNGFVDPEQISTSAFDSGTYILTVSNPGNGCVSLASTIVTEDLTGCSMVVRKATSGNAATFNLGADSSQTNQFVYKTYPNPVNTTAFIEFNSPTNAMVSVEIYGSMGVREKLLFSNAVAAGQQYKLSLDASQFAAGVHYCLIRVNNKLYTSKLLFFPQKP
jgi:hypothetical protein